MTLQNGDYMKILIEFLITGAIFVIGLCIVKSLEITVTTSYCCGWIVGIVATAINILID